MPPANRGQRLIPYLIESPYRRTVSVTLPQLQQTFAEMFCRHPGSRLAIGQPTEALDFAGDVVDVLWLRNVDRQTERTQFVDMFRRIAAMPGDDQIRPQGGNGFQIKL